MRICLIGVTNPCHNPRLTREADTLSALGHDVRVVAPSFSAAQGEKDRRLLSARTWRLDSVDMEVDGKRSRGSAFMARATRRMAESASRRVRSVWLYERAYVPGFAELAASACREAADWYVAHAQGALPVAAHAAARWGAKLGFDCEDLLSLSDSDPREAVLALEKRYLPQCHYVSVTSQGMADYLVDQYHIPSPTVLYNVFPRALAEGMVEPNARPERAADSPLRLHWFGQMIGAGRGLEEIIQAMGEAKRPVELHLRGMVRPDFREALSKQAAAAGVARALHFHPVVDHDDLIRGMGEFDVGLALERPDNPNYSITVTNKFFSYMLAGLALIATDTLGQREALACAPECGALYRAGNSGELAGILARWADDPGLLRQTQQSSWTASRQRYCWDIESRKLLERLEGGVGDGQRAGVGAVAKG